MKNSAVTLRAAAQNDCRDIWHWRNCLEARKGSFNSKPILWREHKKWFDSRFRSKKIKIYIAEQVAKKVGVIRFESKGKFSTVSISLNPEFFGKGLGSKIIKIGTIKFLSEHLEIANVMAEIVSENVASQKAFEKAGYVFTQKMQKDGINADIYKFKGKFTDVF